MKNAILLLTALTLTAGLACGKAEDEIKAWFPEADLANNPRVTLSVPAPGQKGVARDQPIIIEFSKPIDVQRCVGAFSIQPAINGLFETIENKLIYRPSERLEVGATYIFNISQGCEDSSGRDLEKPYTASFSTGSELTPPNTLNAQGQRNSTGCTTVDSYEIIADFKNRIYNSTDFCSTTPIEINFSEPMKRSTVEANFGVSPAMIGAFVWMNNDQTVRFTPRDELQNGVTYVFSIGDGARDLADNNLTDPETFSFTVGNESMKPRVVIADGYVAGGAGPDCAVTPVFNPVLASTIDPLEGLRNKTGVCADVVPALSYYNTEIQLYFSEDMDIAASDAAFSVSPAINGVKAWTNGGVRCGTTDGTCTGNTSLLTFTPTVPWLASTTYTVTMRGSARDISKNVLGENFSFSFTIGQDTTAPRMDFTSAYCGDALCAFQAGGDCTTRTTSAVGAFSGNICAAEYTAVSGQELVFIFNEPMERSQTAAAFGISPNVDGVIEWLTDTQMAFRPSVALELNKQYEVRINASAQDRAGNNLSTAFVRRFTTSNASGDVAPPTILSVSSDRAGSGTGCNAAGDEVINGLGYIDDVCSANHVGGGAGNVFRVVFNEPMDQSLTAAAFSLSPAVSGGLTWAAADTLVFTGTQALDPNVLYTLSVNPNARDTNGNGLAESFTQSFHTPVAGGYPTVTSVMVDSLGAGGCAGPDTNILAVAPSDVCLNSNIVLTFSEGMDRASVESSLGLSPSASGVYTWNAASTQLTFNPDGDLNYAERYTLSLGKDTQDAQGHSLQSNISSSFVVGAPDFTPPDVNGVDFTVGLGCATADNNNAAGSNTAGVCVTNAIVIHFSENVKPASAGSVSLSPFASFSAAFIGANTLVITPLGTGLKSDTSYSLTVDTSVEDPAGNNMSAQFGLSFVTEDITPRVQAVGLQTQNATCNSNTNFAGCWWNDSTGAPGPAALYTFRAGSSFSPGCTVDRPEDNFRIIFNRDMNISLTQSAIRVRSLTGVASDIRLMNAAWSQCSMPGYCSVVTVSYGEPEDKSCGTNTDYGAGGFNLYHDAGYTIANYPLYEISVDQTAEDVAGNSLSKDFIFYGEAD